MQFECPQCHRTVIADEDERGQEVSCLACGAQVRVPEAEDEFSFQPPEVEAAPAASAGPDPYPQTEPASPAPDEAAKPARRLSVVRRANPLAAASLILGFAGLVALGGWVLLARSSDPLASSNRVILEMGFVLGASFIVWLSAVVTGFVAQGEIARSNGAQGGRLAAFLGGLLGLGCLVGMGMLAYTVVAAQIGMV